MEKLTERALLTFSYSFFFFFFLLCALLRGSQKALLNQTEKHAKESNPTEPNVTQGANLTLIQF